MRRYAPAFIEACRLVRDMGAIRLAKVHDLIGRNSLVSEPTSRVVPADDIPAPAIESLRERTEEQVRAAIGDVPEALKNAYRMMLGLSTHDLSAMREMLGMPAEGFICLAAFAADATKRRLLIMGTTSASSQPASTISRVLTLICRSTATSACASRRLRYALRAQPAHQTHRHRNQRRDAASVQTVTHPGWGDAFTEEWRAFHHNILTGQPAKSNPQDFRNDLVLFRDMIQLMVGGARWLARHCPRVRYPKNGKDRLQVS